jgi:hypothetical protein
LALKALIDIKANEEYGGHKRKIAFPAASITSYDGFVLRSAGLGPRTSVCKFPQISTPANTTNTETTAAETRIESMGIGASFDVEAICRTTNYNR